MVNLCETQIVSALSELPHCVIYICTVYERRRGGRGEEEGEGGEERGGGRRGGEKRGGEKRREEGEGGKRKGR